MDETSLHKKLQLARKYHIQPEDIPDLIDDEPVINTLKEGNREAFLMSDFVMEENIPFDIKNAKHFIYWKLKDEKSSVKIIGIAWMDISKIILFKGEILKP